MRNLACFDRLRGPEWEFRVDRGSNNGSGLVAEGDDLIGFAGFRVYPEIEPAPHQG